MTEQKSYFDQRRPHSKYHFDNSKQDQPGEWFNVFGRFVGSWHEEAAAVIAASHDVNWENIAGTNHSGQSTSMTPDRLRRIHAQELDIVRGGGNPKMTLVKADTGIARFAVFKKMIDHFGLEQVKARAHVQMTGQVFNYHLDLYPHYAEQDQHRLIRIIVALEDWVPGHFYLYGTHHYSHWRAGDYHTFKWQHVPHATANASLQPRLSLIITGLRTEQTDQLLSEDFREYQI